MRSQCCHSLLTMGSDTVKTDRVSHLNEISFRSLSVHIAGGYCHLSGLRYPNPVATTCLLLAPVFFYVVTCFFMQIFFINGGKVMRCHPTFGGFGSSRCFWLRLLLRLHVLCCPKKILKVPVSNLAREFGKSATSVYTIYRHKNSFPMA